MVLAGGLVGRGVSLPQVPGELGRREDVCVRRGNAGSLRRVIACEVLVAAKSQEKLIIKIKCLFLPDALLSPICCILFLLSAIFFAFLKSPFDVFLSVVPHPYFLSIFIYCCFFTHACLYSFSFPKYFLFCLSCPSLPYSLATFHVMEQCS